MASLQTIFNWFKTGLIPTEAQFRETFSSFFHKDDKIAIENVNGLGEALQQKATQEALTNHTTDPDAHPELRIYAPGQLLIFKSPNAESEDSLEVGDMVRGWVGSVFIAEAIYLGGPTNNLESFNILNQHEFNP